MNGKLQEKTLLGSLPINRVVAAEAILMFLLGAIAILLHAKFKTGIKLPGHHGLEFMALLLAGRSVTKTNFAAAFFSIGVASMLFMPFMGFKDPFMAFVFTVPGFALDLILNLATKWRENKIAIILIAGFSYALIPVIRCVMSLFAPVVYPSLLGGLFYPFVSHLAFAIIGAAIGTGLVQLVKNKLAKSRN